MSDLEGLRKELEEVEKLICSGAGDEIELIGRWNRLVERMDSAAVLE